MTRRISDFIQNWRQLKKLRISDLRGPAQEFLLLRSITGVATLVLRNCNVSGTIPAYVWRLRLLQMLIGMEYVDMYLVHWPVKLKPWACSAMPNEQDFDKLDIVGTWAGMEKCLQMGLCRAIGVTESYSILSWFY
ncbi:hypothetical protein OROHE_017288 [Orobanche hederae]